MSARYPVIEKEAEYANLKADYMAGLMCRQVLEMRRATSSPLVINMCGSGAAGKSTLTMALRRALQRSGIPEGEIATLGTDGYLHPTRIRYWRFWGEKGREDRIPVLESGSMYTEPKSIADIRALKAGKQIIARMDDPYAHTFKTGDRIGPARIIIIEGVYASNNPVVRELSDLDMAITEFSDKDRLERKIERDITPIEEGGIRGYSRGFVLRDFVEKQFNERKDVLVRDMAESSDFIWDHSANVIYMKKKDTRLVPMVKRYNSLMNVADEAANSFVLQEDKKGIVDFAKTIVAIAKETYFESHDLSVAVLGDFVYSHEGLITQGVLAIMEYGLDNEPDKAIFRQLKDEATSLRETDYLEISLRRRTTTEGFGLPTLAAHIFRSGRLNWVVRILLSPAIILHELAHLFEGLVSGRLTLKDIKPLHLLKGIPGDVRGPPLMVGMLTNLIVGILGLLFCGNINSTSGITILTVSIMNLVVFAIDLTLPISKEYRYQSDLYNVFIAAKPQTQPMWKRLLMAILSEYENLHNKWPFLPGWRGLDCSTSGITGINSKGRTR